MLIPPSLCWQLLSMSKTTKFHYYSCNLYLIPQEQLSKKVISVSHVCVKTSNSVYLSLGIFPCKLTKMVFLSLHLWFQWIAFIVSADAPNRSTRILLYAPCLSYIFKLVIFYFGSAITKDMFLAYQIPLYIRLCCPFQNSL